MRAARTLVDRAAENTYGVNTGFGRFVSESIPDDQVEELQLRLLRSHACGVGEPYPAEVVRAAMLLRANALAKGYSGAHVETVELLIECLNRGVLPRVPARGSVGASGDLAPLAHLALPLVGEGRAVVRGHALRRGRGARRGGARADQARGEGGPIADQRHAVHDLDGRARARRARAPCAHRRPRLRALARVAPGLADELPSRDPRRRGRCAGRSTPPRTSFACSRARRSSSRIAGATRCRTPTRCGARRRCTEPAAICSTMSRRPSRSS